MILFVDEVVHFFAVDGSGRTVSLANLTHKPRVSTFQPGDILVGSSLVVEFFQGSRELRLRFFISVFSMICDAE